VGSRIPIPPCGKGSWRHWWRNLIFRLYFINHGTRTVHQKQPAEPRTHARYHGRCLVERLTEGLGGERSVWGAERSQGDMQLAIGDTDIACSGEQLPPLWKHCPPVGARARPVLDDKMTPSRFDSHWASAARGCLAHPGWSATSEA
jgi:hypothetical protein